MAAKSKNSAGHSALPNPSRTGRVAARILLSLFLVLLALWIAQDFLNPLSWAVVIAVASWPLYIRFRELFPPQRRDMLAPLSFTLLIGTLVVIPLVAALSEATLASNAIASALAQFRQAGIPLPVWLPDLPFGHQLSAWWSANLSDPHAVQRLIGRDADGPAQVTWARSWGGEIAHRGTMSLLSLIATFALLRRGAQTGARVLDLADRLFGDPGEKLARKLVETVRGTVSGTISVALGEGIALGAAYVVAGVPRPFLFALITAALAMVPLGAWVVFSFASALVIMQGESSAVAVSLFAYGAVVMIIGDTMIWPWLVGEQARLPFLIAIIGIFGGLQTLGLIGLFVGPVLLAACWIVLQEWFFSISVEKSS